MSLPLLLDDVASTPPAGLVTFTDGVPVPAADLDTLQSQMVQTFATRADRDLLLTSPMWGQITYIKDYDEVQVFRHGKWSSIRPHRVFVQYSSLSGSGDVGVAFDLRPQRFYLTHAVLSLNDVSKQIVTVPAGGYWRGRIDFEGAGSRFLHAAPDEFNATYGGGLNGQGSPWPDGTYTGSETGQFAMTFAGICWSGVGGAFRITAYLAAAHAIAPLWMSAEEIA